MQFTKPSKNILRNVKRNHESGSISVSFWLLKQRLLRLHLIFESAWNQIVSEATFSFFKKMFSCNVNTSLWHHRICEHVACLLEDAATLFTSGPVKPEQ